MGDLVFDFSTTQANFVLCDDHIVQLTGPMGEGKTHAGSGGCIFHAQRCGKDIRGALVRDTFQNIKTSTIPSLREILGDYIRFSDGEKRATIMSQPRVELDLFGIDGEGSLSKLQGPEYAIIWLEEPAPIIEKANAGLPKSVFNMAVARAARQSGTVLRVQITQNPADEDHWTAELDDAPHEYAEYVDPDTAERFVITKQCFHIQRGENKYLSGLTRAANIAAFKDDPGKYARYVLGQTAAVIQGKQVTPAYRTERHFTKAILPIWPNIPLIMMWDAWHHPACVVAQYTPFGQLVLHDVCVPDAVCGAEDLAEDKVLPLLNSPKYKDKIFETRIIGDPTMSTPDQSSRKRVTSRIIEDMFKKYGQPRFERGPTHWRNRKDPINQAFIGGLSNGDPKIMISGSAYILDRGFKGGWHYKTDNSGRVIGATPVQNKVDHPCQAAAYGAAILMPYSAKANYDKLIQRARQLEQRRLMSYSGGMASPMMMRQ